DIGFLKLRKDGLWSIYSMDWDGMETTIKAILLINIEALKGNKQIEMDRERLKKAERISPVCLLKQ
ncbi:hypothetical protein ACFLXC_06475, partial [Chloroflexota bacterium]